MDRKLKVAGIRPGTLIHKYTPMNGLSLPIGLAYVLGSIKDLDIEIKAIDGTGESPLMSNAKTYSKRNKILGLSNDEILKRLGDFYPDVVLLTCMFSVDWLLNKDLIKKIRKKFPKSIIIGGGEHFSAMPEFCLKESELDCVVYGEGEDSIKEIISKILNNEYGKLPVEGTYIKINGKILQGAPRARIRNLDYMPWPAWEFFDVSIMLDNGLGHTSFGKENFRPMPLNATRGCPYECTFCSNPQMWGRLWRTRPAEDVIAEMKFLMDRYKANHFDFTDLTLAVKKTWLIDFCKLLIKEKLPITWGVPSGTRVEVLDNDTLPLLKEAGLNDVTYAAESGSATVLKNIKKKISLPDFLNSLKQAVKIKLRTKVNIIIGFPDETRFNTLETWWFAMKCALIGVNDILVMGLSIYPGSEDHKRISKEKKVEFDDEFFDILSEEASLGYAPCYSKHYTRLELNIFKFWIFSSFYAVSILTHPKRIIILIKDLISQSGSTRLSVGLINLMKRRNS